MIVFAFFKQVFANNGRGKVGQRNPIWKKKNGTLDPSIDDEEASEPSSTLQNKEDEEKGGIFSFRVNF